MPELPRSRCDPELKYDARCVQNVWRELTANTHFNINELSHNDVKVPSPLRSGGDGVGRGNGRAQLANDSLVINHL